MPPTAADDEIGVTANEVTFVDVGEGDEEGEEELLDGCTRPTQPDAQIAAKPRMDRLLSRELITIRLLSLAGTLFFLDGPTRSGRDPLILMVLSGVGRELLV